MAGGVFFSFPLFSSSFLLLFGRAIDHSDVTDADAAAPHHRRHYRATCLPPPNARCGSTQLPEQPRPKTYMEEQAEARPDRAAFEGTLPMGNTPHDPDYNEPDDIEQRTAGLTALQAMARKVPKSGQGKGTAKPAKAFGLREEDVIKVVKDRIFSMAVHPSTEQTVFAGVHFQLRNLAPQRPTPDVRRPAGCSLHSCHRPVMDAKTPTQPNPQPAG